MKSLQLGLLVIALILACLPVNAASRHVDLDAWLANDLTPFLREQLNVHPRFKGESLRFVVLQNGKPQATSNSLTTTPHLSEGVLCARRYRESHQGTQTRSGDRSHQLLKLQSQPVSAPDDSRSLRADAGVAVTCAPHRLCTGAGQYAALAVIKVRRLDRVIGTSHRITPADEHALCG